jgi:hypothetical protein
MIDLSKTFGRLGNSLFQYAFLYACAKRSGIDFYFQDESFFKDYADEIKDLFGQGIGEKINVVAIHVRRGDYVQNPFYVDLTKTDYYQKAMAEFPNERFVVFSDDIEWCKEQEIFKDCEFSHSDEKTDMNNFASCIGQIIANSSFSWWGAYLSPYSKKIVAPSIENWYSDGEERTKCPVNWKRI